MTPPSSCCSGDKKINDDCTFSFGLRSLNALEKVCACVCLTDHVHVKERDPLGFQVFAEAGLGGWHWVLVLLPVLCFHGIQPLQEVIVHPNTDQLKKSIRKPR